MKHIKQIIIGILFTALFCSQHVQAQSFEAQQLVLNFSKLKQLESILDNMYKGYKILSTGYNTIKDISEGNFNLHDQFLSGLYAVSPVVRQYKRVPLIIQYQQLLVKEYKRAFEKFRNDPNLTVKEIKYISNLYSYIFKQSLRNLDELITIVTASKLRMNDAERLRSIDRIYLEMERKIVFLQLFIASTQLLVMQRAKAQSQINTQKQLQSLTY